MIKAQEDKEWVGRRMEREKISKISELKSEKIISTNNKLLMIII